MIAKVLIILFLVIPLILAVLAFLIGALYLQVQEETAATNGVQHG